MFANPPVLITVIALHADGSAMEMIFRQIENYSLETKVEYEPFSPYDYAVTRPTSYTYTLDLMAHEYTATYMMAGEHAHRTEDQPQLEEARPQLDG